MATLKGEGATRLVTSGTCGCPSCLAAGPVVAAKPVVTPKPEENVAPSLADYIKSRQPAKDDEGTKRVRDYFKPSDEFLDRQGIH